MTEKRPQILLVEEDPLLADVTSFRLELLGYDVVCATSADAAQRHTLEKLPSLIMLDTHLPDVPGLELVNRLSADSRTANIPILVFSIDADLETVRKAVQSGAKDFLVVPFDPTTLEQKVQQLIEATPAKTR